VLGLAYDRYSTLILLDGFLETLPLLTSLTDFLSTMLRVAVFTAFIPCSAALAQIWPHQTLSSFANTTTTTARSATTTNTGAAITPPPCCWFIGGNAAVEFNSWYNQTQYQTVATVVTTILQYDDTTIVANSSTRTANSTFDNFGLYGGDNGNGQTYVTALPSLPTDILPGNVLGYGDYGGTSVYLANATNVESWGETSLYVTTSWNLTLEHD
jgi:hypothetical protein